MTDQTNQQKILQKPVGHVDTLKGLYNDVINLKEKYTTITLSQMTELCNRIIYMIPELDPRTGGGIQKMTTKQKEDLIVGFINKVQNLVYNNKEESKEAKKSREAFQQTDRSIWDKKIEPYYQTFQNSLQHIAEVLDGDKNTNYTKMYNALTKLGLFKYVIFDKDKHEFQFLPKPNRTCTRAIKLNKKLFQDVIDYMKGQTNKLTSIFPEGYKYTNQIYTDFLKTKDVPLHNNVESTQEYKFIIQLLSKISLDKRSKKISKQLSRRIKDEAVDKQLSVSQSVDKIFKKFKSFNNYSKDLTSNEKNKKRQADLELWKATASKGDALASLSKVLPTDLTVIDNGIQEISDEKKEKFLERLKYKSSGSKNILNSIYAERKEKFDSKKKY